MNICFFTKHEITWGSSQERIGLYLPYLKDKGHETSVIHLIPNWLSHMWIEDQHHLLQRIYSFWFSHVLRYIKGFYLFFQASHFDFIVIQKINVPSFLLRLIKKRNPNLMFDADDLCFDIKNLKHFKHIVVGNEYLASVCEQGLTSAEDRKYLGTIRPKNLRNGFEGDVFWPYTSKISILPTAINCDIFFPIPQVKKNNTTIIGWAGSGENHFEYLKLLVKIFEAIGQKYPIQIKIIGSSSRIKNLFQSSFYEIKHIDWLATSELAKEVRSFDIGVMPLTLDPFSQGKCGFKALMYMASGVATIVSPVGINQKIIQDGQNGLWADNEEEWIKKLEILITQESTRHHLAEKGRKTVETFYSLKKNSKIFTDLIEGLSNDR